jgi:hypothetical protein
MGWFYCNHLMMWDTETLVYTNRGLIWCDRLIKLEARRKFVSNSYQKEQ